MARYSFYTDGYKKVICVSHYAGKSVKGVANCSDADEFNFNIGKNIAQARCDEKIALRKFQRAIARRNEIEEEINRLCKKKSSLLDRVDAAAKEYREMRDKLENITCFANL